jgi:hypothetical protein
VVEAFFGICLLTVLFTVITLIVERSIKQRARRVMDEW